MATRAKSSFEEENDELCAVFLATPSEVRIFGVFGTRNRAAIGVEAYVNQQGIRRVVSMDFRNCLKVFGHFSVSALNGQGLRKFATEVLQQGHAKDLQHCAFLLPAFEEENIALDQLHGQVAFRCDLIAFAPRRKIRQPFDDMNTNRHRHPSAPLPWSRRFFTSSSSYANSHLASPHHKDIDELAQRITHWAICYFFGSWDLIILVLLEERGVQGYSE
ncbi:hypothetical protein DFJ77DRAFT_544026 [Powellomyces hirtus]|nr:hypothetical protein DFJ77DRAFT_544026 [Powellomyces hirtus]